MIKLDNVWFSYKTLVNAREPDEKPVLTSFSLELNEGEAVAVMGESGSGKTTLIKLLLGLLKPDRGEMSGLEGRRVAVVFQEDRLLPWYSARENIALVLDQKKKPDRHATALELLNEMELADSADKPIRELSGGMQRRVAIARALAFGGDILLLDEPFKGLDEALKKRIAAAIMRRFKTILLITHDEDEAKLFSCRRVYELPAQKQ